jgi:hypothetical protein
VTLEISNTTPLPARIYAGEGLAQVLFSVPPNRAKRATPIAEANIRRNKASLRRVFNTTSGSTPSMSSNPTLFVLTNETPATSSGEFPQVIRRDLPGDASGKPRVVPWVGHKIARAVAAACIAEGQEESIGRQVQAEVEFRMLRDRPSFIHIEELQDMVEETLIEIGHPKIALAYGKYRAKRAVERGQGVASSDDSDQQLELATREQLSEIRARISFAKIGLALTLGDDDVLVRLLRSTSINLTPLERRETIVLNAKSLLDLDADARFFAARILLSYIYEETLQWTVSDGPQALKEAHRRAFLAYIPQGVALFRLDPRLAEFDLPKLAVALDPFADLQFDFIAIQTLFDRYLIHDTDRVTGRRRRLEAPQIFWMRVAMGLAILEKDREARAAEFYSIYKSRRACSSTPTLFNAGTLHSQLSSCYLLYCGDSIEEITETWRRFSHLSKWAGRAGLFVDGHSRRGRAYPRNQWRELRRDSVSQGEQRHRDRRKSGRQAARSAVQLFGIVARGHRGLPRLAQGDGGRPAPHAQHEYGALDSRCLHEAAQGHLRRVAAEGRNVDPAADERLRRPS